MTTYNSEGNRTIEDRERDNWRRDPDYPVEDWQDEVAADNTRLGYLAWVEHQRMMAEEEQ